MQAKLIYITGYSTINKGHSKLGISRGSAYNKVARGKLKVVKVDGTTFIFNGGPVNHDITGLTRATKAARKLHISPHTLYDAVLTGKLQGYVLIDTLFVQANDPAVLAMKQQPLGSIKRKNPGNAWNVYEANRKAANRSNRRK